jgi:cysteinyl-tRNA synthetase
MTIRFFILQAHYRSTVDFSNDALQAAEKGMTKLMNALETLEHLIASDRSTVDVTSLREKCYKAMNDDFNTPILISHLFDGVRIINSAKDESEHINASDIAELKDLFQLYVHDILGLQTIQKESTNDLTNEVMDIVLQLRSKAKENKDWSSADLIRDELNKLNIQVKDGKEGSSWELKNN